MDIQLTDLEARIIGCLIEKEVTTPDHYPLSLNALTAACNQKSSRDPVMSLTEAEVEQSLAGLRDKHLVVEKSGFGSRVPKHRHRFCNTQFGTLQFSPEELALVCVLLLRGPQTPGELRSRTGRLYEFADVGEVETTLSRLAGRDDGPFVAQLPREPGRRESRYAHLFSGEVSAAEPVPAPADHPRRETGRVAGHEERLAQLERQVSAIQAELEKIRARLD